MNLVSPAPFWPIRDGLPEVFPPLQHDVTCDVAVVGAGISGALVAWHLVAAGFDTVVLDGRDVAHGSTAGSTSLVQYELDEPLDRLAYHFGWDFAARAYQRCRAACGRLGDLVAELKIECGFSRRQSVLLAANAAHLPRLRREFAARRRAGFDVDWWSRARLRRESTLPHPAAIVSADAAQLDPYRLTYGLLAHARARGARIFDRTRVNRRRARGRGIELTCQGGARVQAREVILATGYEADAMLPERVTALYSTYAIASEPVASLRGWPAHGATIWETRRPYLYLRTTADGRVLVGGYDECFRDPRRRDALLGRKAATLLRRFRAWFPHIPIELATAWAGTFANTAHGLPFIGPHPRLPRTWFALGYGGNGVTFSLIAAEIITAALRGRQDPDADLFGFERQPLRR